jgi:uncharacterized protein
MIKSQLEQDLKQALLAGDSNRTTVLRGLKSVILYAEVAAGSRESGLPETEVVSLLQKEAKKRQESADLYIQGGDQARADQELSEKKIIETYLPAQLSEDQITELVDKAIAETGATEQKQMGAVIAKVKEASQGAADGATVARIARQRLEN